MEALAGQAALYVWDNSTRGLDSASAVDYVKSLRIMAQATRSTNIVTLYQAGESVFREFDKVCVVCDGRQIFFGKTSEAQAYFETLGYEVPLRSTTADFLSSMGHGRFNSVKPAQGLQVPMTSIALEEAFRTSVHYERLLKDLYEYREATMTTKPVFESKPKLKRLTQGIEKTFRSSRFAMSFGHQSI